METNFDLFGQPVPDWKGKRGRPPYEPTDRDRNKIKLLLALGWSIERMANGLGVSPATVKRYFRAELKQRDAMRDRLDARRFEIAMEQANAGNVAALKELGKMIERSDTMLIDARLRQAQGDRKPEKDEKLGKKETQREAAKTAGEGSSWGADLLPGVQGHC
ncbi:helix-turn-helix domain-containing protein [Sinorhizobium meliloti]|uniref:helix-turn-helix domain-containing protein n=1 Tax=Rhizobium meliloti TaxID=382 RepID=UPI002380355D|nr:helix-turn-helix domain-containing protein [Sinorhizobium meliloti]MDE3797609.1 helix-turn-helix domain-containing protein [Sinorhizobium meliloti]